MKKTAIFGIVAVLLVGFVATTAFAFPFGGRGNAMGQTDEMTAALESGDYGAYLNALDDSDRPFMAQHLTQEQFQQRSENLQEMEQRRQEMEQAREKATEAIEAGDYDAWVEAHESMDVTPPIMDLINEDNFDTFVELYNARMSWDFEKVQELQAELGIEGPGMGVGFGRMNHDPGMRGSGRGMGMGSGNCPFSDE